MKRTAMALVAASLFWPAGARAQTSLQTNLLFTCFDKDAIPAFVDGGWTCPKYLGNPGVTTYPVVPKCDDGWFLVQSNGQPMCAHELRGPTHN